MEDILVLPTTMWGLLKQVAPTDLQGSDPALDAAHRTLLDGEPVPALAAAAAVLQSNPQDHLALVLSADGFTACGKRLEALELLQRAVAFRPHSPAFQLLPGQLLLSLGRAEEAQLFFERGLTLLLTTEGSDALGGELQLCLRERLVQSLLAQNQLDKAWIQLEPLLDIHHELSGTAAEILMKLGRPEQALPLARRHCDMAGTPAAAQLLARCHFRLGDQAAYAGVLCTTSANHPEDGNLSALASQAIFDQANSQCTVHAGWQMLERGLAAVGQSAELSFLEARQLLLDGCYEKGWIAYQARLQLSNHQLQAPCSYAWQGESPAGRSIVVVAEQGVGDVLLFARFLPALTREAGTVYLLVEPRLTTLLRLSYPDVVVLEQQELARVLAGDRALWIPLASLPMRYGTTVSAIVSGAHGDQLRLQPNLVQLWSERLLLEPRQHLRIGVSLTAGSPSQEYQQRKRSVDAAMVLGPLEQIGAIVIDLQHRDRLQESTIKSLQPLRFEGVTRDLNHLCALISKLDLMISSDQTNVFLAGMLGVPTLAVVPPNPHFMFGREGSITPWFNSLRIVRAPRWADWDGAREIYCSVLKDMLSGT